MRILITGASSFTGHNVVQSAINEHLDVVGTYRNRNEFTDILNSLHDAPELVQLDLSDLDSFKKLNGKFDAIVHIAAISDFVGTTNEALIQSNILGTNNIIKYAQKKDINRIVNTSSTSVYGEITSDSICFDTPIFNPGVYGLSKYAGERLLASVQHDISSVSLRLPGVLGRGASRSFIPLIGKKLLADQPVTIFNEHTAFNNVIHVNDLSRLIFQILEYTSWNGFHAFPVAADNPMPMIELTTKMKTMLGSSSDIIKIDSDKQSFVIDSQYATNNFGYNPRSTWNSIREYFQDIQN